MDLILSKRNPAMKKRASFSFLFSSQKPTFALLPDEPPRYYHFVDTPVQFRPSSPYIDRQKISPDLEADIRHACTLLVHRIDRGVPSRSTNDPCLRKANRATVTSGDLADTTAQAQAQIDSKYISPNVGPEAAALKDKYDSGVGLTQQTSRQTMRGLQSPQSDKGESGNTRPRSPLNQIRCSTAGCMQRTSSHPSVSSPKKPQMQSINGGALEYVQPQGQDTKDFLTGAQKSLPIAEEDVDDLEVFLNPDATLMSSGVASFASPQTLLQNNSAASFGAPQSKSNNAPKTPVDQPVGLEKPDLEEIEHQPGVIIDGNGLMHVMTAEEEAQRKINLQQAVMARMRSTTTGMDAGASQTRQGTSSGRPTTAQRPQSVASRLQTSWSNKTKGSMSKWRTRTGESQPQSPKGPSVFQKIASFFGKRHMPSTLQATP